MRPLLPKCLPLLGGLGLFLWFFSACVSNIDLTGAPCGTQGECGPEHICSGGICQRDVIDQNAKKVKAYFLPGAPCEFDSDCDSDNVSDSFCKLSEAGKTWTGGYCSRKCSSTSNCTTSQSTATCLSYQLDTTGKKECRKTCQSNSDCRDGYTCRSYPNQSNKICEPT